MHTFEWLKENIRTSLKFGENDYIASISHCWTNCSFFFIKRERIISAHVWIRIWFVENRLSHFMKCRFFRRLLQLRGKIPLKLYHTLWLWHVSEHVVKCKCICKCECSFQLNAFSFSNDNYSRKTSWKWHSQKSSVCMKCYRVATHCITNVTSKLLELLMMAAQQWPIISLCNTYGLCQRQTTRTYISFSRVRLWMIYTHIIYTGNMQMQMYSMQ